MDMDSQLPDNVKYFLNQAKKDCFFNVGPASGPNELISAIKLLLMSHSEPMCRMLEESDMAERGVISLPDIEPNSFKDFLKCVYGGSDVVIKHLTFEECAKLLYIAEKYLVAQVKRDVVFRILNLPPLSINDLFVAFNYRVFLQEETITKVIAESIKIYTDIIFDDERFLDISSEALLLIVQQEPLNVKELGVFKAVVKWAENKADSDNGSVVREYISEHIKFIRFRVMSIQEFSVDVIPTDILTTEEACRMCTSIVSNEPHKLTLLSNNKNERLNQILRKLGTLGYSYDVKNICDNKYYCSDWTELGKYCWQLNIKKVDDDLGLYLYCKPLTFPYLSLCDCNVTAELILVNQCGRADYKMTLTHIYESQQAWGYPCFKKWADVVEPSQGFIKHGRIVVAAYITLT